MVKVDWSEFATSINTSPMSRQLPGTRYHVTGCDVVIYLGIVNVFIVSDRLKPMWHDPVEIRCMDFAAITAS